MTMPQFSEQPEQKFRVHEPLPGAPTGIALDPLTQIANRSSFEIALEEEFSRATTIARPLSVLIVAIGQLDEVYEAYGRTAGDAVLRWLASIMQFGLVYRSRRAVRRQFNHPDKHFSR
jgi:diguanylate cyclase (GGDEF)-like protein